MRIIDKILSIKNPFIKRGRWDDGKPAEPMQEKLNEYKYKSDKEIKKDMTTHDRILYYLFVIVFLINIYIYLKEYI